MESKKINLTKKEVRLILMGLGYSLDYENKQDKDLKAHNKRIEKLMNKIQKRFFK